MKGTETWFFVLFDKETICLQTFTYGSCKIEHCYEIRPFQRILTQRILGELISEGQRRGSIGCLGTK